MPPLSIMVKPVSSMCNLSCEYCFYRDVSEHRENMNFGIMNSETCEALIKKALDFAEGCQISFVFQGGEPLLAGIDYFKNFVKTVEKHNKKGSTVCYGIQTNGTLIDGEWAEFLSKNNFLVGLSLDGDYFGNKFRKSASGSNTYHQVISAAECLKRNNVQFNILTVLTGFCAENAERIYKLFRSKGFRYLQFIPCLRPFGSNEQSELYMTGGQYADFLIKTFTLYVKDYVSNSYVSVRQFDNWVRLYLNHPSEQCGMQGYCTRQFAAESNGNIYPCDFYCTDEYLLGNINDNSFSVIANCERAKDFIVESFEIPQRCRECEYYALCRSGGCKRTQLSEDYCTAYKKFFSVCMPLFRAFINEKIY